jgi:hypothetical protein
MVEIRRPDKAKTILAQEEEARKDAGYNLIFTEWKDIGEGRSPMSDEWRCSATISCRRNWYLSADDLDAIVPNNIRTRFERSIGNDVEDLPVSVPKCRWASSNWGELLRWKRR